MPSKTALLVIDMQKEFDNITVNSLPNVQRLIEHSQSSSIPVIFIQHGHSKEELETVPSPNRLVRKWGADGSLAYGSENWEFQDGLKEYTKSTRVVGKNTYDSFINTNLQQLLDEDKTERVIVSGVQTDACCDSTARSAFNRGYETWMVSDACATDTEEQHQAALKGFKLLYGSVMTTSEAIAMLEKE